MFKYLTVFILTVSIFFYGMESAEAQNENQTANQQQNISASDLSNIKVDQLTDAQLRNYMQRAQEAGLTQTEVETALKARGMPDSEILKLKQRVSSLTTGTVPTGKGISEVRTRSEKQPLEDVFEALKKTPEEIRVSELQKKIFGFDLFSTPKLSFAPSLNIPTPKNYQLGPGDEIIIDIWGASEQTYQQVISPDGYIIIPNLGPIYLNGLSIDRASDRIKSRLTKIYSGLNPKDGSRPNTFMQVSLGQVRTIKVAVIGEIRTPGTYDVSSLSTVFNALYLSGGPNVNGSFREIELIRENKILTTLDVYDFLINGIQKNNVQLEDQDIIRVMPYSDRVEIEGEVKRPGIYEIKKDETFADLIRFTGGFSEGAYKDLIKVERNTGKERKIVDISGKEFKATHPQDGDYVTVRTILDRFENRVQIAGAVFREGVYELTDSLTVSKLIDKADGLTGDAYLERAMLYRTRDDFTTEAIAINLRELLKDQKEDISLQREDFLKITSIYDLKEEYYVNIAGSVREPGNYPFMEDMTIEDLILQAGGLLESADPSAVEVARRVKGDNEEPGTGNIAQIFTFSLNADLSIRNENEKFILKPFDNVFVRRSPAYQAPVTIRVEGELTYPGDYILKQKDERISDIISRAGGLTREGYAPGATLIRRTEFYEMPTEREKRYNDLLALRKKLREQYTYSDELEMSESEKLQSQRLANLEREIQNYRNRDGEAVSRESARQRRETLQELQQRDTTVTNLAIKRYETIGIDLSEILASPGSKYDLILQDGDIISVPKKLETVRLRGELLYPVTVRYDGRFHFKDYVAQAGGFTDNARKRKSYVIYANGSVDKTKKTIFGINDYPEIQPGAEIIVPAKPERQGLSAQAWIAMSTSLATFALVIQNLIK